MVVAISTFYQPDPILMQNYGRFHLSGPSGIADRILSRLEYILVILIS
jgi:hypothetical protein